MKKSEIRNTIMGVHTEQNQASRNGIYEPFRRKMEEWIWYDDHKPDVPYYNHETVHDEYRRWHDRDCVLTGGNLKADTMFSLWLPLRHTITRLNDAGTIRSVGNISRKYEFLKRLIKGDNLEKLLPENQPVTAKLSRLFDLGMGRENVFLLPCRELNSLRGCAPYWDYIPAFLQAAFPDGAFAGFWDSHEAYLKWICEEHFQVFFDGEILQESIRDLSGSQDVGRSLPPEGIQAMEHMIDQYIRILEERRKCFGTEELTLAKERERAYQEDRKIQEFRGHVCRGDNGVLEQISIRSEEVCI